MMVRPPESWSRVATDLANTPGLRYGITDRLVWRRSREVCAAAKASVTKRSRAWWPPVAIHSSLGNGWSVQFTASAPAASVAWAISATAAAVMNSSNRRTLSVGSCSETFTFYLGPFACSFVCRL